MVNAPSRWSGNSTKSLKDHISEQSMNMNARTMINVGRSLTRLIGRSHVTDTSVHLNLDVQSVHKFKVTKERPSH